MRAVLVQEYEHFEARTDESLTDTNDMFLTLLNNLCLVEKVYVIEDLNTKFPSALPEEWYPQISIIRHQYDLDNVTLDEIYEMLRTHYFKIQ